MKKLLLLLLLTAWLPASADDYDYPYLTLTTADGEVSVSVTDLTLNVEGGTLVLTNAEGTVSYPLSTLTDMYFSESAVATGISEMQTTADATVSVYSVTGQMLGTYANVRSAREALHNGVYIIKSDSGTYKMTKR